MIGLGPGWLEGSCRLIPKTVAAHKLLEATFLLSQSNLFTGMLYFKETIPRERLRFAISNNAGIRGLTWKSNMVQWSSSSLLI